MDAKEVFSKAPLLARTTFKHYTAGPPQKSWNISFHLIFVLIKTFIIEASLLPVEVVQKRSGHPAMFSTSVVIDQFFIPQSYHQTAQKYLEKILKPYEAALDDEWKDTYNGIGGEWVYEKNRHPAKRVVLYLHGGAYYLGSAGSQRPLTSNLAKAANAKVLAINYRLAPQNQFPAALHDALAAYLYLLEPPEDAGFEAYKPEEIVISGDSAGGGLTLATCLAIRDAGLPTPAGAVGYSPWLDLTHSMPSVLSPSCQETDYLPDALIRHPPSPALERSEKRARALSAKIKKMGNLGFKFDERVTEIDEKIHLYAPNEALWIPYVSPLLAEDLSGLPPLLIQTGHGERIRDESILFAFKLGNPQNVGVGNSDKSTGVGNRGEVTLEVYDDMPHVFQMFSIWKPAKTAFTSTGNFIRRVTDPNNVDSSVFNAFRVTVDGKFLPLNEDEYRNVLNWDRVGKLPQLQNVDRISLKPTSKTEIDIWPTVANMAFFFALISLFFWTT